MFKLSTNQEMNLKFLLNETPAHLHETIKCLQNKSQDSVVEANRELLLQRSNVGIRKYGTTLEKSNLSEEAILQHALEEALDLANYLQTRLMQIRDTK